MLKLPTLYKQKKKGAVTCWEISVVEKEGRGVIVAEFGQVGGAKQTFYKEVEEGKNIGRKNETTPFEQACVMARAVWNKKRDSGFGETAEGVIEKDYTIPMAAQTYMEYKHTVTWPYIGQPKLNGVRCVARKIAEGNIRLTTKNGKHFVGFEHIREDLNRRMRVGQELDGELYRHGMPLEDIVSIVRRTVNPDRERMGLIQYHIFDTVNEDIFSDRLKLLQTIGETDNIKIVSTVQIFSEEEAEAYVDDLMINGYEGAILRNPKGRYLQNYRSADLLKFKKFIDAEFRIIGGREGTGKMKGQVVFRCITESGEEFDVVPEGSKSRREWYLKNLDKCIGKMLTTRFQTYTKRGVPEFPVGVEIRDYE